MKTQAWGWLTAAVLAAGLNSSYHDGGLQWAHEIANRVEHNTGAVYALATRRADRFLAEARVMTTDRDLDMNNGDNSVDLAVDTDQTRCPLKTAMAQVQNSFDDSQFEFEGFQGLTARQQAQLERLEANRARIEAQIQANMSRLRLVETNFSPVVVDVPRIDVPRIDCPRVRVRVPRIRVRVPRIQVPAVRVDDSDQGPF